jgi:DNA-binding Lrp family transcriptional regulator
MMNRTTSAKRRTSLPGVPKGGRKPIVSRGRHKRSRGPLDPLDVAIVEALQADGRASLRRVARLVGASVTTVSSRVRGLHRLGVLQGFVPLLSVQRLAAMGRSPDCTILYITPTRSSRESVEQVARNVAQEPNVCYLFQLAGSRELVALASSATSRGTQALVRSIAATPGVARVRPMPILRIHKERPHHPVGPPLLP